MAKYNCRPSSSYLGTDEEEATVHYTKPTLSSNCTIRSSEPYNLALGPSNVGNSKSLISPAASLRKKLILSLPRPLLTMLN